MSRSAGLTLGGILSLVLGGASAVQADDLSASAPLSAMTIAPALYGVFSRVPENWSDLPVQLHLKESVGYNSNILNTPLTRSGATTGVFGQPIGSIISISDYGAGTKAYWEGQQFFADGSIGMYRYFSDGFLNSLSNKFDIGDNWTYGSKCSGKLVASEAKSPSEPGQQVGFNVLNIATTIAFDETAKCIITGNYSWVLNSGLTNTTNSAAVDKLVDSRSVFIAAGIDYVVTDTDSLRLLATVTGTDYPNIVTGLNNRGLSNQIVDNQVNVTYTKNFGHNLALTASGGVVGVRNGSFSLKPAKAFQPIYSANLSWTATPKLQLTGGVSRIVSPPTAVLANLQTTLSANLGLTYAVTPKMLFAATASASRFSGLNAANTTLTVNPAFLPFALSGSSYSANASLNYAITPFATANLSYTRTKFMQGNFVTPTDIVLLALTFNPY